MFRRIAFFLVFLLFSAVLHAAQPKEALLIANGKYSHFAGLAHPATDASKLGAALEGLGFRVRVVRDGNREQMLDAISEFERGLRNTGAIAFFHYGGHGVQVDGKNYLLPADADIPDERRVATRAVALDEVMTAMDAASARASIIVIDACRDNPLPAGAGRNLARGLSVVGMKPKNSIVIYAAEAGSKALDGLFTPILATALQEKGRTIDQVMKKVRSEVYAKSSGQQTPGEYNQLFEELFLGDLAENGQAPRAVSEVMPVVVTGNDPLADLREGAEQGDAYAQYNLGISYDNGEGVAKDQVEAVKWYRKAADQGNANAQYNLGNRYYNGEGVAKDLVEAVKWFRKAADQGDAPAQYSLGVYYDDGEGVAKDQVEAVKWLRKAADQGHAPAQYNLGMSYANGEGVAKDQVEAVKWFRKAADQGNAPAQFNLGNSYINGFGVAKDLVEAYALFNLASVSLEQAKKGRDLAASNMTREQVAAGQKRTKELQREPDSN
jgi:TPR repeat protein